MIPFALPRRLVSVLAEETTLFASVIKWMTLASAVGTLAGPATAAFLAILNWATGEMQHAPLPLLWLPVGFIAAHLLVTMLAPEAEGHGTHKVIEAVDRRVGKISLVVAPVKRVATVVTIAAGGSVGKEGPAAHWRSEDDPGIVTAGWKPDPEGPRERRSTRIEEGLCSCR